MADLAVSINEKPDEDGSVVKLTPESAGWEYVGFTVLRLDAGRRVNRRAGNDEVCLVFLEGYGNVMTAGGDAWRGIGGRDSVFEGPPYAVYLPPETDYTWRRTRIWSSRSARRPLMVGWIRTSCDPTTSRPRCAARGTPSVASTPY